MNIRNISIFFLSTLFASAANAGTWLFVPSVTVEEIFTDNVLQAANNEDSDFITRVTPRFSVQGTGRRFQFDVNYQLTEQYSREDSNRSQTTHQFATNGSLELYEQIFFTDFKANVSQQAINNNNNNLNRNFVDNDDIDDVMTFEISPYFVHRLGSYADTEFRTTFNKVYNESDRAEDSSSVKNTFTIKSGQKFPILPWRIIFEDETIDEDNQADQEFRSVDARINYIFNRSYTTFVDLGYEDNEFLSNDNSVDQDGSTWAIGVIWTPSSRTRLSVGIGEELFGNSVVNMAFTHKSRRTVWSASYDETITNTRALQLEIIPLESLNVDPLLPPDVNIALPTLVNEVFVNKRFKLGVKLSAQRTVTDWTLFHDTREFQLNNEEEIVYGTKVNLDRDLSRTMLLNLVARWQETEFRNALQGEEQVWSVGFGLTKELNLNSSAALSFLHIDRDSDIAADEFTENSVSISYTLKF